MVWVDPKPETPEETMQRQIAEDLGIPSREIHRALMNYKKIPCTNRKKHAVETCPFYHTEAPELLKQCMTFHSLYQLAKRSAARRLNVDVWKIDNLQYKQYMCRKRSQCRSKYCPFIHPSEMNILEDLLIREFLRRNP